MCFSYVSCEKYIHIIWNVHASQLYSLVFYPECNFVILFVVVSSRIIEVSWLKKCMKNKFFSTPAILNITQRGGTENLVKIYPDGYMALGQYEDSPCWLVQQGRLFSYASRTNTGHHITNGRCNQGMKFNSSVFRPSHCVMWFIVHVQKREFHTRMIKCSLHCVIYQCLASSIVLYVVFLCHMLIYSDRCWYNR